MLALLVVASGTAVAGMQDDGLPKCGIGTSNEGWDYVVKKTTSGVDYTLRRGNDPVIFHTVIADGEKPVVTIEPQPKWLDILNCESQVGTLTVKMNDDIYDEASQTGLCDGMALTQTMEDASAFLGAAREAKSVSLAYAETPDNDSNFFVRYPAEVKLADAISIGLSFIQQLNQMHAVGECILIDN